MKTNIILIILAIFCVAASVSMLFVQINRDENASLLANENNPVIVEETETGSNISVYHNGHRHCWYLHSELATKSPEELHRIVITNSVVFYWLLSVVVAAMAVLTVLSTVITAKDIQYDKRKKSYC